MNEKVYEFCVNWIGTWYGDYVDCHDDPIDLSDTYFYELLYEIENEFPELGTDDEAMDAIRITIYTASIHVWCEARGIEVLHVDR